MYEVQLYNNETEVLVIKFSKYLSSTHWMKDIESVKKEGEISIILWPEGTWNKNTCNLEIKNSPPLSTESGE